MAGLRKPQDALGYSQEHTLRCEQVLVTLLNAFGTLKGTLRLVGGLVPRYLTPAAPPHIPVHYGTSDVDMVLNLQLIAEGQGYSSLAQQLLARGFTRHLQSNGWSSGWQWECRLADNTVVLVEFLQGAINHAPGSKIPIDGEDVTALAIRHAEITHRWYCEKQLRASLLDGGGVAVETIRYADVVSFIILKALAFDQRNEPKDAADLIHVMRYAGTPNDIAGMLITRLNSGEYPGAIAAGIDVLQRKFAEGNADVDGYLLTGPVKYAQFVLGNGEEEGDERIRQQRFAAGLVTAVLKAIQEKV